MDQKRNKNGQFFAKKSKDHVVRLTDNEKALIEKNRERILTFDDVRERYGSESAIYKMLDSPDFSSISDDGEIVTADGVTYNTFFELEEDFKMFCDNLEEEDTMFDYYQEALREFQETKDKETKDKEIKEKELTDIKCRMCNANYVMKVQETSFGWNVSINCSNCQNTALDWERRKSNQYNAIYEKLF